MEIYTCVILILGKINGTLSPSANNLSSLSSLGHGNVLTSAPSTPSSPGLGITKQGVISERGKDYFTVS